MSAIKRRIEALERTTQGVAPVKGEFYITGGMPNCLMDQATAGKDGSHMWSRAGGETAYDFRRRVRENAAKEGLNSIVFGGMPNDNAAPIVFPPMPDDFEIGRRIRLPSLHSGQIDAWRAPGRFKVIRCGRRWGKTWLGEAIACSLATRGMRVGLFAPDYKITSEFFREIEDILHPVKRQSSIGNGIFRTNTGGRLEVWSLENERAGRSRKYHQVIIDEAAFAKDNTMSSIWDLSIGPTLLDFKGSALVMSTPNGRRLDNFFWKLCNDPIFAKEAGGFVEFHAPTSTNPHMPADELTRLQATKPPLVFRQEYLAEFIDWRGVAFFSENSLLLEGKPVQSFTKCAAVYAVIDTAIKTGKKNDGTAVTFFAYEPNNDLPLQILDWDIVKIEGASLTSWLPGVFQRLEYYAKACGARYGSQGAHIEDKASGSILLQHAQGRGWPATPIDSVLTAMGKDERAIAVSEYVYQGKVKITQHAYDKTTLYDEQTRNHFLEQVCGFQIGVPDQHDDLLDTFTYGVSLGCGGPDGV